MRPSAGPKQQGEKHSYATTNIFSKISFLGSPEVKSNAWRRRRESNNNSRYACDRHHGWRMQTTWTKMKSCANINVENIKQQTPSKVANMRQKYWQNGHCCQISDFAGDHQVHSKKLKHPKFIMAVQISHNLFWVKKDDSGRRSCALLEIDRYLV